MTTTSVRWCLLVLLAGCTVQAEPGWQDTLEQLVRPELLHGAQGAVVGPPADAAPASGDRVEFALTLARGERRKQWRLAVAVSSVAVQQVLDWRETPPFDHRVQPGEERRREIARKQEEFRLRLDDLTSLATDVPVVGLTVEAFDADGKSLGSARSSAILSHLHRGLLPACHAGHRQRERMRGRVEAGLAAPMLTVDDATYDDIQVAARGVATCRTLFTILQSNPVTRDILREVLELPSVWSLLTHWGVKVSFAVDFFAAERVDPARFPGEARELWSVPVVLLLNGEPGFLARVIVGPSGSPDGAVAGVYGLIARHPSDASRQVVVRLVSSRRGSSG